ncbi:hypothetical protein TWF569_009509 [Orbilia oligospora]|uniref:Uncharacterized protein n=1 Tax=Orbilia oligospora TaxID=2813651 RepID=A0A7C8J226_ORBOL|nr:hypothetical protein TWF706_000544 [Orbilia oligospora]KAF3088867.1 hypothetical protein TWF102_009823 [Orbilia oligospora]KAF3104520.1 hypothetical protein TWF103_006845 [Orbilia oligospora]KAF3126346.1 hypothetical protein TWF594_001155 [Orbilia oligospora]KAF3136200.1 hypothetical protein TWF569_009509 [Orbilia oligospora]
MPVLPTFLPSPFARPKKTNPEEDGNPANSKQMPHIQVCRVSPCGLVILNQDQGGGRWSTSEFGRAHLLQDHATTLGSGVLAWRPKSILQWGFNIWEEKEEDDIYARINRAPLPTLT